MTTIKEVEFVKRLKLLLIDVGVKKIHFFYNYSSSEEHECVNFDCKCYIEFNNGTIMNIGDSEWGYVSACVYEEPKSKMIEDRRYMKERVRKENASPTLDKRYTIHFKEL
jgi:hypothetical protein